MKILFLAAANSIHTVRWVNSLVARGNEVHLVYNANHVPTRNKLDKKVIQHRLKHSGNIAYYLNAAELRKLYREIKPDIVNAHYASGYGTLARMARVKTLLLSVWGSDVYDFPYQSIFKMHIVKKNISYANHIASTSKVMAKQVEKIMDKKMDISVTPFGVDIEQFKNIYTSKKEFCFGVVKTLEYKYGIEYIIKSFFILLNRIKNEGLDNNVVLKIYGEGKIKGELENLCKELGIMEKVIFKGYVPNIEVPNALNKMDVFCLGSILDSESFGVAAVEAMSCGVPVIATDVDGFKEVIEDEQTGYIVPRKDEVAMAEKMYELMIDNNKRKKMGEKGRIRVEELYNWENNITEMENVYKMILYTRREK